MVQNLSYEPIDLHFFYDFIKVGVPGISLRWCFKLVFRIFFIFFSFIYWFSLNIFFIRAWETIPLFSFAVYFIMARSLTIFIPSIFDIFVNMINKLVNSLDGISYRTEKLYEYIICNEISIRKSFADYSEFWSPR